MEANIVVRAEDLTNDFADGLRKIFSGNALLHIKVEYDVNDSSSTGSSKSKAKSSAKTTAVTGKKRGRKANPKPTAATPKKRGPKPKVVAA